MSEELKLFNGRCYGVLPSSQWKRNGHTGHIFVAAYNVEDARRLCRELGLNDPGRTEVVKYWNKDCWGNSMEGVTPERGVWLQYDHKIKPKRIKPPTPEGER
jgi:hypothetical protein